MERGASCPAAQCGASSYHGNEESAASSPCHLSDGSQAGQHRGCCPAWSHSFFGGLCGKHRDHHGAGHTGGNTAGDILVEGTRACRRGEEEEEVEDESAMQSFFLVEIIEKQEARKTQTA